MVRGWASADDDEASAALVAVNRLVEKGGWADPDELVGILAGLRDRERLDVAVGYDNDDLDSLIATLTTPEPLPVQPARAAVDPGPDPVPVDPITVAGDVWTLGAHRVVCGDSTDPSVYEVLLGVEIADVVWTDPPYGVTYEGGTGLTIENDNLDAPALTVFLRAAFGLAAERSRPGATWFVTGPDMNGPFQAFLGELTALGIYRHTLVWLKDQFVLGQQDYHYRHELMFFGWKPGGPHRPPPTRSQDTVWEFPRPRVSADHPTMKPVGLIQRAIENHSDPGAIVLDPFGGSGSTLIAAHRTGRVARLIEKAPGYVDVICRRYQRMTGDLPARPDGSTADFLASGT